MFTCEISNDLNYLSTRIGDFTWRVSDSEELVGVTWSVSVSMKI